MNKINFNQINAEIIHVSDNNMTINFVLCDFNINILNNIILDLTRFFN